MDIRNWFHPKNTSLTKKEKPQVLERNGKSKDAPSNSKKRRIIVDSDSDENPTPTKKPHQEKAKNTKSPSKANSKTLSYEKSPPKALKATTASIFFGSAPVERTSKITPNKKSKNVIEANHNNKEFLETLIKLEETKRPKLEENHEDDDFTKTLEQLEGVSAKKAKTERSSSDKKRKPKSPKKSMKTKAYELEITPPPKGNKVLSKIIAQKPTPEEKKKKRGNAGNYMGYMHREGPRALGTKEIPEGEVDCLKGLSFLLTGVLECIERDDAKSLIEGHGGKFMTTLSKNTNYIIIGRDAGCRKLEKAVELGTIQLTEDEFFDLVRTRPGKVPKNPKTRQSPKTSPSKGSSPKVSPKKIGSPELSPKKADSSSLVCQDDTSVIKTLQSSGKASSDLVKSDMDPKPLSDQMWVDKYKPTSLKQLINQQGPSSNAQKLLKWVQNWDVNAKSKKPAASGRWNSSDGGMSYKAALLSGPPGVGKTTTAQLVCKETGFDYVEFNASDTRSKKSLQQAVSELLLNQSLAGCFKGNTIGNVSKNHLIIMDEVDGMAGNEDRGGMQELISFIKTSKIPIICICNDRNHPKIRSLSNYCFDLRFQRPSVGQIKAAMMSVAFKEKLKTPPNVLQEILQDIITASRQDIRQSLHTFSLWASKDTGLSAEQMKKDINKGMKHVKMNPFDVTREVFAMGLNSNATLNDKADLFFHDYSICPLFVQENYVHVLPSKAKGDKNVHLDLLSEAADSICIGDLIEKQIRSQSSWNLLPVEAIFASVVPGAVMAGNLQQMVNFPAWLGKNSNRNHMDRILQELQMHMRTRITGNKTEVMLEYLPLMKHALTRPLIERETDGIADVLKVMEHYYLLREDFDNVVELSNWSTQPDPRTKISSKVKSAFTRTYNKSCCQNPYAVSSVAKKKRGTSKSTEDTLAGEDDVSEEEEDDEEQNKIENDAMIKVKKQPAKKTTSNDAGPSSSSVSTKGRKKK